MIRPLTCLPRSWRMTETEEAVIETMAGAAARRLKVRANLARFGSGDPDRDAETLIRVFDGMRLRGRT